MGQEWLIVPHMEGGRKLVVVGAGPAGLTAAFEAQRAGIQTVVFERDPEYVGGISRTVRYKGYRFDLGGHRFFSQNPEITRWWKERLPDDFIQVKRLSRIYYRGRFFDYPLRPWNAFVNLGPIKSIACAGSYVWARLRPRRPETSFEDWVSNRFGRQLFRIFFKTYTEKVWGVPTAEISADWAAQRIKGLSLSSAVWNAFRPRGGARRPKSLIDTFGYPRRGPGQMWEKTAADFQQAGGRLFQGWRVQRIIHAAGRVTAVEATDAAGAVRRAEGAEFILSMPLQETVASFDPPLPLRVREAAGRLRYRDFLTIALILDGPNPFPDNWIYIHEPAVKLGRIQNFGNWSAALIAEPGTTCLGLEYFCTEGDGLWTRTDAELIQLGGKELERIGLVSSNRIREGTVVRMEKAYPLYDHDYAGNVAIIRAALDVAAANLQVVGRNGMHKYNNQDHSMLTAMLAVKNLRGGRYNLWHVNTNAEYHEGVEADARAGRQMPKRVEPEAKGG